MNKKLYAFLIAAIILQNSGCASVVSGKSQDVQIRSNPPGAELSIDGAPMGPTPMIINLRRNKHHTIKFSKEGYSEEVRTTGKGFNWWFVGNIALGAVGVIGIIVDFSTGGVYKVSPEEFNVALKPKA